MSRTPHRGGCVYVLVGCSSLIELYRFRKGYYASGLMPIQRSFEVQQKRYSNLYQRRRKLAKVLAVEGRSGGCDFLESRRNANDWCTPVF